MTPRARRSALLLLCPIVLSSGSACVRAQVFTVGEKTATADVDTSFKATHVELPDQTLTERGRRGLVRNLDAEQGFARRILPLGTILTLQANGNMTPGADGYKQAIYKKGQVAAAGDRVVITKLDFKPDRILIDLNGGPYPPHRFLRHIQIGVGGVASPDPDLGEQASGCRIALVFEGGIPELSAPEVKALLEPIVDFGVKTGEKAYADTLPTPIKNAIASHEVLVGMDRRMVLAALGQPESKVRETNADGRYEEWIYGKQPQPVKFVRFVGDKVSLVKIAALGKPMEIHDHDEMAGYQEPGPVRVVIVKDGPATGEAAVQAAPPTLKLPNETSVPAETSQETGRKVQYPVPRPDASPTVTPASQPTITQPAPAIPAAAGAPPVPPSSQLQPSAN